MERYFESFLESSDLLSRLFGEDRAILESKRRNFEAVVRCFKTNFAFGADLRRISIISVPNRVELLGKHTDYQGGKTLVMAGPKNFFEIGAPSLDDTSEFVNAIPDFGKTVFRMKARGVELLVEGFGSQYTVRVAERFSKNLVDAGFPQPGNVKVVFLGDIPIGGGTSGSSSKVISDFLTFASCSELLDNSGFKSLIVENGRKAGIKLDQKGMDNFLLSLSMYLAHYENGLDFGDLRGDRGVGTFGGSEDHTAILLGRKGKLLFCRYCPTEVLDIVDLPGGCSIVVAFSGKRAEKTKEAMEKYNRLSRNASLAVGALNEIHETSFGFLRDFYQELDSSQRAEAAFKAILKHTGNEELAGRAFQFYMEEDIIVRAVESLKRGDLFEYGALINESHELSKEYLKNIVDEVDFLKKSACGLGAFGASGFGGGFGGCCYAIIKAEDCTGFVEQWKHEYLRRYPELEREVQFDVYPPCGGSFWAALYPGSPE